MKYNDFAKTILFSGCLEDKLVDPGTIEFDDWSQTDLPLYPERTEKYKFSEKKTKFPKDFTSALVMG